MENLLSLKKRYPILQMIANLFALSFFIFLVTSITMWIFLINKLALDHSTSTQNIISKGHSILSGVELLSMKKHNFLLLFSVIFYLVSLVFAIITNSIIAYISYKNNWKKILIFSSLGIFVSRLSGFIVGIFLLTNFKKIAQNFH